MKTGILLMNLGTPDAPTPEKVGEYLKEFLMDPNVIDIPLPLRWFFVNVLIVPKRSHKSAEAYQKIWTERGSPLKFHTEDLTAKVKDRLQDQFDVRMAMRYQNPSIESVFKDWKAAGIETIKVLPLYPQYALSSSRSSEEKIREVAKNLGLKAKIEILKPFYKDPGFISAFSEKVRTVLGLGQWDHLLLSYHGLPMRQIRKADPTGNYCFSANCCDQMNSKNEDFCYRAHCYETSRQLANQLQLKPGHYSVSFQSRLGVSKWITPYTDIVLNELADKGVKDLVIACPAFTADCLETLEEIEMRANEQFLQRGGRSLRMVPSLNSSDLWVDAVCEMVTKKSGPPFGSNRAS